MAGRLERRTDYQMDKTLIKLAEVSENITIANAIVKTANILNRPHYHNIMVSLSGGGR